MIVIMSEDARAQAMQYAKRTGEEVLLFESGEFHSYIQDDYDPQKDPRITFLGHADADYYMLEDQPLTSQQFVERLNDCGLLDKIGMHAVKIDILGCNIGLETKDDQQPNPNITSYVCRVGEILFPLCQHIELTAFSSSITQNELADMFIRFGEDFYATRMSGMNKEQFQEFHEEYTQLTHHIQNINNMLTWLQQQLDQPDLSTLLESLDAFIQDMEMTIKNSEVSSPSLEEIVALSKQIGEISQNQLLTVDHIKDYKDKVDAEVMHNKKVIKNAYDYLINKHPERILKIKISDKDLPENTFETRIILDTNPNFSFTKRTLEKRRELEKNGRLELWQKVNNQIAVYRLNQLGKPFLPGSVLHLRIQQMEKLKVKIENPQENFKILKLYANKMFQEEDLILKKKKMSKRKLLTFAILYDQPDEVKRLLQEGADPYYKDRLSMNAAEYAVREGKWHIVQIMMEQGVDFVTCHTYQPVDSTQAFLPISPLGLVARFGSSTNLFNFLQLIPAEKRPVIDKEELMLIEKNIIDLHEECMKIVRDLPTQEVKIDYMKKILEGNTDVAPKKRTLY